MKQRTKNFWKRIKGAVLAGTVILSVFAGGIKVHAETGSIYTCTVTRCYSHPVTGVIEDSGGEASYATGQGMVESVVGTTGMLEVTDSGNYYLTVRLGMMDYTTGHSFVVQNVGDSSWMSTTTEQTATGSDSNGTTADFRIQVPSESCVVRCSMNVTPMGRDVIFYFYPGSYTEGNSSGMTAGKVTEAAAVGSAATADSNATVENQTATSGAASTMADAATNADNNSSGAVGNSTAGVSGTATNADSTPSGAVGNSTAATAAAATNADSSPSGMVGNSTAATSGTATADSSATVENAAADSASSAADGQVQGLSLSTAQNAATAGTDSNTTVENTAATVGAASTTASAASTTTETGTLSMGQLILVLTVSMTIAGWIVLFTAIGALHYIKKRRSWDGDDDEEE